MKNLVCNFRDLQKDKVSLDVCRNLLAPLRPDVIDLVDPDAPLAFIFRESALQVLYFENRLQVTNRVIEYAVEDSQFIAVLEGSLRATGGQEIMSFGFNFEHTLPDKDAGEWTQILVDRAAVSEFDFMGVQQLVLKYEQEDLKYVVKLTTESAAVKAVVNIHHDSTLTAEVLATQVGQHFDQAARSATLLLGRLLGDGPAT